ncbi:MAG: LysR family transcriptional regulator [Anaeromyxobacter sp.]
MNRRLDSRRLETFRVVAQVGRISAAAKVLHLSQPAVTAQIRQLEEECGAPLFVRSPTGVVLNDAGQRLLEYAQKVDHLLHEAAYAVHEGDRPGEQLVLAASQTTAASVVPRFVAAFRARRPGLGVRVDVGNTTEVLHWLSTGAVPLGVVEGLPRAAGARLEPFLEDELIPVASTGAPREVLALESAEDLGEVPVVWREVGSGSRAVVERALEKAGLKRKAHPGDLALGSNDAVRAAVLMGLGLGFMSKWTIQTELEAGRLRHVPLPDLRVVRSFAWALPAGEVGGIAGQFLKESRRVVGDLWSTGERARRQNTFTA